MRFPARFWWYNAVGWTGFALLEASLVSLGEQLLPGPPPDLVPALVRSILGAAVMVAITPLIVVCALRIPLGRPVSAAAVSAHVALGLLFAGVFMAASWATNEVIFGLTRAQPFVAWYLRWASTHLFWYFVIVVGTHEYLGRRRLDEREVEAYRLSGQLTEARLELLKMQLHPHFLFNTLNVIAELIHQDAEAADRMVSRLGDLLRATMRLEGAQRVRLREELELLAAYLDIQHARFGDRLLVEVTVDRAAAEATCPPLLLQPLAENAIRHGISPRASAGRLQLSVEAIGGELVICMADNGVGPPVRSVEGVGFRNTRARLQQMYNDRYELTLRPREGGGAEVVVRFPLEMGYGLPRRMSTPVPAGWLTDDGSAAEDALADRNGISITTRTPPSRLGPSSNS